jgi:hypothetical protein
MELMKASTSVLGRVHQSGELGEAQFRAIGDLAPFFSNTRVAEIREALPSRELVARGKRVLNRPASPLLCEDKGSINHVSANV